MNLRKRGLVFATFVGSCVALALVLAALSTRQWVVAAAARRTGSPAGSAGGDVSDGATSASTATAAASVAIAPDARGRIALGLFTGRRHLNVGYGWRAYEVDVVQEARVDPSLLHLGLWTATVASLGGALILSALCGLLAVLNAAASPGAPLCAVPGLYIWNTLAMFLQLTAVGLWIAQFEMHLRHNVMSREDRENKWDSEGMAALGASFWFVVGAAFVHALNLLAIYCGTRPPKDKTVPAPILEEKGNGAIMLY